MLVNLFFVFWVYQYLLARIPAGEFSIYPVLIVTMTLVPVLVSVFASALSRGQVAAYASGQPDEVVRLHSSAVLAVSGLALVLVAIGAFASANLDSIIVIPEGVEDAQLMAMLICLDVALSVLNVPYAVAFEVRQRFVQRDVITSVGNFVRVGLTFVLLLFVSTRVIWVPVASLAATSFVLAATFLFARRLAPEYEIVPRAFRWSAVRYVLAFGFWTSLGTVSMMIYQGAGPILLNLQRGPDAVNAYFVGSVVDRRILSIMTVALAPLLPVVTTMSVRGDTERLGNTYVRGGRYALWISMALACPMIVFADAFIDIYLGPGYSDAAGVMVVFLVVFPAIYADIMLSRIAIAVAKVRLFFSVAVLSTISMVAVAFVVLETTEVGAVGVALAISGVNLVVHVGFFWPYGLRLAGVRAGFFLKYTVGLGLIPAAVGGLAWAATRLVNTPDSWFELIFQGALGGVVYVAVLVLFCLRADERRAVARVVPGRLGARLAR